MRHGVEIQFLVNYLSHFLLVTQLLDSIPRPNTGESSLAAAYSSIQTQIPKDGIAFSNLDGSASNTALLPFTANPNWQRQFLRRSYREKLAQSRGSGQFGFHPGATRGTNLNANLGFPLSAVLYVAQRFMKTVEQGAATQVLLAASPLVNGITGNYWADGQVAEGSPFLKNKSMADRLWGFSEDFFARNLKS